MITSRIAALRTQMSEHNLDAYIIQSADPHNSEYSADYWHARKFISGFTGSAGTIAITQTSGGLWADGRYHIQADEQLAGSGLITQKQGLPNTPELVDWLIEQLPPNARIGLDGRTFNIETALKMQAKLALAGIELLIEHDLLTPIWTNRPARPSAAAMDHGVQFAGLDRSEKITLLQQQLQQQGLSHLLVSALDDVAWLLNIRGADVTHCPVVEASALVSTTGVTLFIAPNKLPDHLIKAFTKAQVTVAEYDTLTDYLTDLPPQTQLQLCPKTTCIQVYDALPPQVNVRLQNSIVADLKSQKNATELAGEQAALQRDGVAMVRFAKWLAEYFADPNAAPMTELAAETKLAALRSSLPGFLDFSFRTIAGYGPNGAKMHYAADADTTATIGRDSFFLVDSGAQFFEGTTDITRTFHFGSPTQQQKQDYTLVLKAMINLAMAKFKAGSLGIQLDTYARSIMWQQGMDYGCGTGHGVGICLNVHEGPQSISPKLIDAPLKLGMLVTNEPGVYRAGVHGVRIENIMSVVDAETNEFGRFYQFNTMTLAPIDTTAIDTQHLTPIEINWLNQYHQQVLTSLSPLLTEAEQVWLAQACAAI